MSPKLDPIRTTAHGSISDPFVLDSSSRRYCGLHSCIRSPGVLPFYRTFKDLDCPTGLKRRIERKREFSKLSNRNREEKGGLMPHFAQRHLRGVAVRDLARCVICSVTTECGLAMPPECPRIDPSQSCLAGR